jgi:hypothetical protein
MEEGAVECGKIISRKARWTCEEQCNERSDGPGMKKEVLVEHFEGLIKLAQHEPRATRFVRSLVGGDATVRGDGDTLKDCYLPASKGLRLCYYRYLDGLGPQLV